MVLGLLAEGRIKFLKCEFFFVMVLFLIVNEICSFIRGIEKEDVRFLCVGVFFGCIAIFVVGIMFDYDLESIS